LNKTSYFSFSWLFCLTNILIMTKKKSISFLPFIFNFFIFFQCWNKWHVLAKCTGRFLSQYTHQQQFFDLYFVHIIHCFESFWLVSTWNKLNDYQMVLFMIVMKAKAEKITVKVEFHLFSVINFFFVFLKTTVEMNRLVFCFYIFTFSFSV
jgi:hypothetical protein